MSQNQRTNKALWLNEQQRPTYLNAKAAVIREKGPDLTEGQVVEELARAYTGVRGDCSLPGYCALVDETAAENGDPVYSKAELEEIDQHELRRMAGEANTDALSGKSTKLEIIAYFSCPYPADPNNELSNTE